MVGRGWGRVSGYRGARVGEKGREGNGVVVGEEGVIDRTSKHSR